MYFNSVLFLLYFFPFFLLFYFLLNFLSQDSRPRMFFLILASVIFYSWSVGIASIILLFCAILCFILGELMRKWKTKKKAFSSLESVCSFCF